MAHITVYDCIVIGFYLAFVFSLGPIFKRFSKTASDYFRAGGGMLWWVGGSSTFMTTFTAWSFTGGAARAYETGTFFLVLYLCNFVAALFTYFFTAAKFRQMRVVTETEGVRKRYGNVNEQVFTWLPIFSSVVLGGIYLYTISVFMHGVFGIEVWKLILALGGVVMFTTLVGGAWAAIAGDFIQILIVLTITSVMAYLTLHHPAVGGSLPEMVRRLPPQHFNWTLFDRPWVIVFFVITLLFNQLIQNNSMSASGGEKYIFVKDGRDARRASLVSVFGFLLLPWVWMIPALGSTIIHPDLASEFPKLNNPHEAAYVSMAITLLPQGLLGLLVCAIFAGTLTTLCSLLNVASGVFVRNFYIRKIDITASETRQIMVGRIAIFINGAIWVVLATYFSGLKEIKLFDLLLRAAASIGIPVTIPLFYGIFVKRTPPWAAWSTMLVGAIFSMTMGYVLDAAFFNHLLHPAVEFNKQEAADLVIATTSAVLFIVCTLWYFGTKLFYNANDKTYVKQVDDFFTEMSTPIDREAEHAGDLHKDVLQYAVLGTLCLIYGCFVLLLMVLPNTLQARLCILFCGSVITAAGVVIRLIGLRLKKTRAGLIHENS